jgi:hypothetical protein
MKLMLKLSILTLLCAFSLNALAQIPTGLESFEIKTSSQNPKPNEQVTLTLESFSVDLSSASIVWIVSGKTYAQGVGVRKITVQAGKTGVSVPVKAVVSTPQGREFEKSITLRSSSVDMILESRGYTPPFFDGKTPLTYQNSVRVIAVPHISRDGLAEIDPKTLVYSWKRDGKYITDSQGYGKQSVDIQLDTIPKPLNVEVEVYNREQTLNSKGSISIEPSAPSVLFYEESSLYGILFNKVLTGRVQLKNEEMRVRAVPYGFNIDPDNDSNTYTWSINNVEQPDLLKNQSITIRPKDGAEGSSNISLDIRNTVSILQGARDQFTLYFTKRETSQEESSEPIF